MNKTKNLQNSFLKKNSKHILYGLIGSFLLFLIYFGLTTWANSVSHAIEQFWQLKYWMTPLVIGFGIQIGLWSYMKTGLKSASATNSAVASGSVSTASMVACCAHHLVDVLPIIGLSAASMFLAQYQTLFLMTGILSNIIGITFMLSLIQKHESHCNNIRLFKKINFRKTTSLLLFLSIIIITIQYIMIK